MYVCVCVCAYACAYVCVLPSISLCVLLNMIGFAINVYNSAT